MTRLRVYSKLLRFTQNEQQLLGPTQGEHRDETAALAVHYVMDRVTETSLSLLSLLMDVCAICRLLQAQGEGEIVVSKTG